MSQATTFDRLNRMAKRFKNYFKNQGLAETSFIASARFRGFPADMVRSVATLFWPEGASRRFAMPAGLDSK